MGSVKAMLAARGADEAVMSARVVVFRKAADGEADLPASVLVGGVDTPVWEARTDSIVGGFPAREYRHSSGLCVVIVRVAVQGARVLAVVWAPAASRVAVSTYLARVLTSDDAGVRILAQWPAVESSGSLTVPALDADVSAIATAVKSLWPATWRVWVEGDAGDPKNGILVTGPSGARCIGAVLA